MAKKLIIIIDHSKIDIGIMKQQIHFLKGPAPYNFKILCFQKHIKYERKPSIILKKKMLVLSFFLSFSIV